MRVKLPLALIVLAALLISGCKKSDTQPDYQNESLVEVWINPQYNDSIIEFDRAAFLPVNNYGLSLKADNSVVERKNKTWCGTPPVAYGDFAGNWSEQDDIVDMEVDFWGGRTHFRWQVLSIDNNQLRIKQLLLEFVEE